MSLASHLPERPVLRADLRLTPDPAVPGAATLEDPLSGNVHRLTPLAAQLAACLDGHHTLAEAAREVAERCAETITDDEVQRLVRDLDDRLLLDTPEAKTRIAALVAARRRRHRARFGLLDVKGGLSEIPLERVAVRPGLRYGCLGCGVCCSGRFRVELNARDEQRLAALDLEGALGRTLEDSVEEAFRSSDNPTTDAARKYLRQENGRCIFLADDLRCEIHRRFGYQHKPLGCRIFPFYPLLLPDGSAILQFRPECSTQHRSAANADLVEGRLGPLWEELADGLEGATCVPASFELRRDQWTDFRTWRTLEAHWVETARTQGWRAALSGIAPHVTLRPLTDTRIAQQLFAAVWQLHAARVERTRETFEHVIGPQDVDPLRIGAAHLGLLGLFRTDAPGGLATLMSDVAASAAAVERLDRSGIDAQLDNYVADFLFGKFTFQGVSAASGLGLLWLVVLGTRLTAACAAALRQVELDEDLVNEALIAWHTTFFNHDDARIMLLLEMRDELEALPGLGLEHFSA